MTASSPHRPAATAITTPTAVAAAPTAPSQSAVPAGLAPSGAAPPPSLAPPQPSPAPPSLSAADGKVKGVATAVSAAPAALLVPPAVGPASAAEPAVAAPATSASDARLAALEEKLSGIIASLAALQPSPARPVALPEPPRLAIPPATFAWSPPDLGAGGASPSPVPRPSRSAVGEPESPPRSATTLVSSSDAGTMFYPYMGGMHPENGLSMFSHAFYNERDGAYAGPFFTDVDFNTTNPHPLKLPAREAARFEGTGLRRAADMVYSAGAYAEYAANAMRQERKTFRRRHEERDTWLGLKHVHRLMYGLWTLLCFDYEMLRAEAKGDGTSAVYEFVREGNGEKGALGGLVREKVFEELLAEAAKGAARKAAGRRET